MLGYWLLLLLYVRRPDIVMIVMIELARTCEVGARSAFGSVGHDLLTIRFDDFVFLPVIFFLEKRKMIFLETEFDV